MKNTVAVGQAIYTAEEHLYYERGTAAPRMEYMVCTCEVQKLHPGLRRDIEAVGVLPGRGMVPRYLAAEDEGRTWFRTARDAAMQARKLTERYERRWGRFEPPLRRTWEALLEEDDGNAEAVPVLRGSGE